MLAGETFYMQTNTCSKTAIRTLEKGVKYIYSKLTKSPGQRQWGLSGVFIVNFEHMLHLFLSVSIVDFEQVNVCYVIVSLLKYCKMVWKDFNPVFLTVGESRDQRV